MGDRSAEMLNIMIAIIAVVALMALGFAVFTISKRMANNSQNDLVNQLSDISQSLYTDLDQQVITGARLKQVVKQASTTDCAILINTLALSGATVNIGSLPALAGSVNSTTGEVVGSTASVPKTGGTPGVANPEASTNGQLQTDGLKASSEAPSKVPMCILENYNIRTSLGTQIYNPVCVNYGSVLKNGIQDQPKIDSINPIMTYSSSAKKWSLNAAVPGWGNSAEYNQTIVYKDGQFITKLEFATNSQTSRVLRYDSTADFDKTGKTMTIADTQQYNSYILSNAGGDYVGLVFIQIRK